MINNNPYIKNVNSSSNQSNLNFQNTQNNQNTQNGFLDGIFGAGNSGDFLKGALIGAAATYFNK